MSNRDPHEYVPGEYTQFTRFERPAAGTDTVRLQDGNGVNLLGYDIQLWDSESGGVQLIQNADYTLDFIDESVSTSEGFTIYGGYIITNAAYQSVPLYLTVKIVGGYTYRPYRPLVTQRITSDTVLGPIGTEDAAVLCTPVSGAELLLTLPAGEKPNEMVTVISDGDGKTRVTGYLDREVLLSGAAQSFIWTGTKWVPVGTSGGAAGGGVSVGTVAWWPGPEGSAIPASALVCDGTEYLIADLPSLFNTIGITWGGDGITTFKVPNLSGITPGAFGTQDIGGNIKGDAAAIGDVREDQFQGHWHELALPTSGSSSYSGSAAGFSTTSSWLNRVRNALDDGVNGTPRTGDYTRSTEAVGRWIIQAFDSVTEIPADPALMKDYVLKQEFATPTNNVPFIWEGGVFFIGIQYTYLGTVQRSNGLIAIFPDGVSRYFILSVDYAGGSSKIGITYNGPANTISCIEDGSDFTAQGIIAIWRWENTSTAVLPQPVDGWELKYSNWTNTAAVPNIWGDGQYKATIRQSSGNAIVTSEVYIDRINTALTVFSGTVAMPNYLTGISFSSVTEDFTVVSGTGVGYIAEIYKFTGMVQVRHVTLEDIVEVDATAGDITITLPANAVQGQRITYFNIGSVNKVRFTGQNVWILPGKKASFTYGTEWRCTGLSEQIELIYSTPVGTAGIKSLISGKKFSDYDSVSAQSRNGTTSLERYYGQTEMDVFLAGEQVSICSTFSSSAFSNVTYATDTTFNYTLTGTSNLVRVYGIKRAR